MKSGYDEDQARRDELRQGRERLAWSARPFGDRAVYKGDWMLRAAVAMAGIYGNDAVEAMYPLRQDDSDGQAPDCSKNNYTLTSPRASCRRSTPSGR